MKLMSTRCTLIAVFLGSLACDVRGSLLHHRSKHGRHHNQQRHNLRQSRKDVEPVEAPEPVEDAEDTELVDDAKQPPEVEKAMGTMSGALTDLEKQHQDMETSRKEMGDARKVAIGHMEKALLIKREEARVKALKQRQEKVLKKLDGEENRLQASHDSLLEKLNLIISPKIEHVAHRLEKETQDVIEAKEEEANWDGKFQKYKGMAMKSLKAKKNATEALEASDKKLVEARKEHEKAEVAFREAKSHLNARVEAARFSLTEHKAAISRHLDLQAAVNDTELALEGITEVRDEEVRRVGEALELGKKRFEQRKNRTHTIIEEADNATSILEQRFSQWQAHEQERAAVAASTKQTYDNKWEKYEADRHDTLNSLQSQIAKNAADRHGVNSDDWAWKKGEAPDDSEDIEIDSNQPAEEQPAEEQLAEEDSGTVKLTADPSAGSDQPTAEESAGEEPATETLTAHVSADSEHPAEEGSSGSEANTGDEAPSALLGSSEPSAEEPAAEELTSQAEEPTEDEPVTEDFAAEQLSGDDSSQSK